jgi:hypothetical protein
MAHIASNSPGSFVVWFVFVSCLDFILRPWRWKRHVSPECSFDFQRTTPLYILEYITLQVTTNQANFEYTRSSHLVWTRKSRNGKYHRQHTRRFPRTERSLMCGHICWSSNHFLRQTVTESITNIQFFNWPNPSSRTMALGPTQPVTEMSTRNLPGGKGRPARKAGNLTAICEPIV